MARAGGTGSPDEGGRDTGSVRPEDTEVIAPRGSATPGSRPASSSARPSAAPTPRPSPVKPHGYGARLGRRLGGAVLFLGVGILVSWWTVFTPGGQAVDSVLMDAVTSWSRVVAPVKGVVTGLVSVPAMVVVAVVVAAVAALRRRPTLAGRAVGVVLGANLSTQLLKRLLERPDLGVTLPLSNSLPSGHTTFAASVACALVIVAPAWLRTPAAWVGWAWTSLMGVIVMVAAWHRPSDVLSAVLVCGVWALVLAPVEHRVRHGATAQRVMALAALVLVALGVLGCVIGVVGVDLVGVADAGHAAFLATSPWRQRLLALAAACLVTGVVGVVLHEIDRLSWG